MNLPLALWLLAGFLGWLLFASRTAKSSENIFGLIVLLPFSLVFPPIIAVIAIFSSAQKICPTVAQK